MKEWEIFIDILEQSVAKHGEKPLTNRWLLNIMRLAERLAEKREHDEEMRDLLEEHRFDIY